MVVLDTVLLNSLALHPALQVDYAWGHVVDGDLGHRTWDGSPSFQSRLENSGGGDTSEAGRPGVRASKTADEARDPARMAKRPVIPVPAGRLETFSEEGNGDC